MDMRTTIFGKSENQASKGEEGNLHAKRRQFLQAIFGQQEESCVLGRAPTMLCLKATIV